MKKKKVTTYCCLLLLASFFTTVTAQNTNTPMMGWSSWNTFRVHINEELIKETADAMVNRGLKDVGYGYVNIDDGYFGGRNSEGRLLPIRKIPEWDESPVRLYSFKGIESRYIF